MREPTREPWQITDARTRRASKLAAAIQEWVRLAEQRRYPRSLTDICLTALTREYALGRKRTAEQQP